MKRKLKNAVVVVTGASSGIGRSTARAFAAKGSHVVLAARRQEPLEEAAKECRSLGARTHVVSTDTSDLPAVERLAQEAVDTFGQIDVWVNNAAVTLFGRFDETPYEPYRRVLEVNLFGYIHGARAVLPYFREQGHGILINNASMVARVGQPYTSAYVISKYGIRALSDCLRQELLGSGIHVCTVLPASIDTPLFQHAANFTGRAVKPMPPIYDPSRVADAIVGLSQRPKREVSAGRVGRLLAVQRKLAPAMTERMMASLVSREHFQEAPAETTEGNIFRPMLENTGETGGWRSDGERRASLKRGARSVAGAAALVATFGVLAWGTRRVLGAAT